MTQTPFSCTRGGLTIRGNYALPQSYAVGARCPAVFLCHGFNMRGEDMTLYAQPFLDLGWAAFSFDFCGGSPLSASDGHTQDMSLHTECADLCAVIDHARTLPFVDAEHLALVGLSMGGMVAAMVAAQERFPIEDLILLAPALCIPDDARRGNLIGAVYDPQHMPEELLSPGGMRVGRAFHDAAANTDLAQAICGYRGRVLLVHGMADSVVPFAYSLQAKAVYGDRCELHLVEGMEHVVANREQAANMKRLLRLHLQGKRQQLRISVQITGTEQLNSDGQKPEKPIDPAHDRFINAVYFTGYCRCDQFSGAIARGAVDRQTIEHGKAVHLCADYTLHGLDAAGQRCYIHIVNSGVDGDWTPVVHTDSRLLQWMNDAPLTAVLEMHAGGLTVCIFG